MSWVFLCCPWMQHSNLMLEWNEWGQGWVCSSKDREDDRIQEPRGCHGTVKVAVEQLLWGAFGLHFSFFFFYVAKVASVIGECMTWGKKGEVQQRENSPCSLGLETPAMLPDHITRIWRRSEGTDGVRQKLQHTLPWTARGELFINDKKYKSYWVTFPLSSP